MKLTRIALLAFTLLAFFAAFPTDLTSCGPFVPQVAFTTPNGPPEPLSYFSSGNKLGVIQPSFRTRNLVAAYRILAGTPLNQESLQSIFPDSKEQPPTVSGGGVTTAAWQEARNAVPGLPHVDYIDSYRSIQKPGFYGGYENCLTPAFQKAAETLKDRASRWGADSPELRDWITAQDKVFANCAKPPVMPDPAPANASALLKADRAYQFASASFYAGNWQDALQQFRQISQDKSSPWKDVAPYLIARTDIRKALVDGDPSGLTDAVRQLRTIINDPAAGTWQASATRLLEFVQARLNPDEMLATVSKKLTDSQPGANAGQELTDFISLYWNKDRTDPRPTKVQNELVDWLNAWKASENQVLVQAVVDRWRATKSPLWLIPALHRVSDHNPAIPELLAAAHQIKPESPAYASVAYYAAELDWEGERVAEAKAWDEQALKQPLAPEDHNLFLAQRFSMATTWNDFLHYAPREVAFYNYGDMDDEINRIDDKAKGGALQYANTGPALDLDSTRVFNEATPLSKWRDAAANAELPPNIQAQAAHAGWVRAVLLRQPNEASAFLARWQKLNPASAKAAELYAKAPDGEHAQFAAVLTMLRNPGFSPLLPDGFGRLTRLGERDSLRDNWWCLVNPSDGEAQTDAFDPAAVLSPAEQKAGTAEAATLRKTVNSGSNYLVKEAVKWARQHPEDPLVPEALARSVEATHYGCSDPDTGTLSKAAFDVLHQRYPQTKWAQQTKYWYK